MTLALAFLESHKSPEIVCKISWVCVFFLRSKHLQINKILKECVTQTKTKTTLSLKKKVRK